jgi:hypothetical protein
VKLSMWRCLRCTLPFLSKEPLCPICDGGARTQRAVLVGNKVVLRMVR